MKLKVITGIMLTLFLIGMLTLAFNVQPAKADWTWTETVYIRADGSVYPATAPISSADNITYTFTDNIVGDVPYYSSAIIIERNNIVVNGAGYTVEGTELEESKGIYMSGLTNVTIKDTNIKHFGYGIYLSESSNNTVSGNNIANNGDGIRLDSSSNNSISGNNIANNGNGIWLYSSSNNSISGNNIANNLYGIEVYSSSNNRFYYNNFIDNTYQVRRFESVNIWDDGYPSGGNYWSDYTGVDLYSGPFQNETGSDGIGDTPYVIDVNNRDHYPLMRPWPPLAHELVVSITAPAFLQLGSSSSLNATVTNQGLNDEADVELSLLINGTLVDQEPFPSYKQTIHIRSATFGLLRLREHTT